MTGILCAIAGVGGGGPATFAVAVGYSTWAIKGAYANTFGYDNAGLITNTVSRAPSPTTFKGETIAVIASREATGATRNVLFGITGMNTSFTASSVEMGGVNYPLGSPTQSSRIGNTVSITNVSGSVSVNYTAHNMTEGRMVYFTTTGTLPSGLAQNTIYYVRSPTANAFYLSTSPGGALIAYSTAGSGTHTCQLDPYVIWVSTTNPSNQNATGGRAPFNPTISVGSPAVVTSTSHGLTNGKRVTFRTNGSLPTGLSVDATYFVVNAATNTFSVSATLGGSAINTTGAGSGTHTCYEVVDMKVS